jgi:hypothetical protein
VGVGVGCLRLRGATGESVAQFDSLARGAVMSIAAEHKELFGRIYHSIWNERRLEFIERVIAPTHALGDPTVLGGGVGPKARRIGDKSSGSWWDCRI